MQIAGGRRLCGFAQTVVDEVELARRHRGFGADRLGCLVSGLDHPVELQTALTLQQVVARVHGIVDDLRVSALLVHNAVLRLDFAGKAVKQQNAEFFSAPVHLAQLFLGIGDLTGFAAAVGRIGTGCAAGLGSLAAVGAAGKTAHNKNQRQKECQRRCQFAFHVWLSSLIYFVQARPSVSRQVHSLSTYSIAHFRPSVKDKTTVSAHFRLSVQFLPSVFALYDQI